MWFSRCTILKWCSREPNMHFFKDLVLYALDAYKLRLDKATKIGSISSNLPQM